MRILQVTRSIDLKEGGIAEYVTRSSIELAKRGHGVGVLSLGGIASFDGDCHSNSNLNFIQLEGVASFKYGINLKIIPWLIKNAHAYDCVIVHGLWQFQGLAIWIASKFVGLKYHVFPHGMLDPWFSKYYPVKRIKKLIYWLLIERNILNSAKDVIFTCNEEMLLSRNTFPYSSYRSKISLLGAVDSPKERSLHKNIFFDRFRELANKKIILFLGRLHEKKGCDNLIKAFGRISASDMNKYVLVFAGPADDVYKAYLDSLVSDNNLQNKVFFLGMLRGPMKWGALLSSDVFCLPSHQENFGIAVVEALACSKPVLITNKINIWREIDSAGAGIVENDDEYGIGRMLNKFLSLPSEEVRKMEIRSRACYEDNFTISRMIDSLMLVLRGE